MRNLFPQNNSTDILGKDSDIVKKEDLLPITEQLQNTIQQLNILSDSLSQYETDNTQAINTTQLSAINAAIQSLEAVNSELATAEVDNLTVSSLAQLTTLTVQLATIIDSFTAPSGIINELQSQEITVGQLNVQNISAVAAEIGEWSVSNLTTTNLTANNKITTSAFESNASDLGVATANSLVVSGNASISGNLSTGDIDADNVEADEMGIENVHWNGSISLSNVETFYMEVPHFENGQYYIQLLDNTTPFITIEVFNSVDNFFVRWSQSDYNQLTHIYKYGEDNNTQLYFKVENSSGNALTLKYATICATPNVDGPATYVELPIEDYTDYEIRYKDGSKFFKNVDLASQGGTVGILRELTSDDITDATSDVSYDTTSDIDIIVYKPDQSLNTDDDVEFNSVDTTFLNVREFSTRNFVATELHTLSTIDLSEYDDGSLVVVRVSSTAAQNEPSGAYVKFTENNTPVLYKLIIGKNLPVSGSNTNKPLIWSVADQAIIEGTNYSIAGTINVSGAATFGSTVSITGATTLSDDLTVAGDTSLKDAEVDGDLVVNGNSIIHGDLYVDGTTHTTTEESISTTGDTITLRQNNSSSLGSDYAGIIINKYDGTHDLALVSDSDGTLRVGTGSGTETTYANIYWDDDTEKWYSDAALTTEVSPSGNLSSWSSLEINEGVKHYTNAVFTEITYATLIPILGRDEDANLNNGGILYWDGSSWKAKTTPAPTSENQVLVGSPASPAFDKHIITINDIEYEEYPTTPFTGTIPTGATSSSDTINFTTTGDYYYSESEDAIYVDNSGTIVKLISAYYNSNDDEWVDGETSETALPADAVAISAPTASHYTKAATQVSYSWDTATKNYVFATMADYIAAASTVPNGSLVIIQNEDNYLIGDNQ